jgi:hypothetical protein
MPRGRPPGRREGPDSKKIKPGGVSDLDLDTPRKGRMPAPSVLLTQALALVSPPGTWSEGAGARDRSGEPARLGEAGVFSRCAQAAIYDAGGLYELSMYQATAYFREAMRELDPDARSIPAFNDEAGREAVLWTFTRAIQLAKRRGD